MFVKNLPMTGFWNLEATALPTEPQPLPGLNSLLQALSTQMRCFDFEMFLKLDQFGSVVVAL